MTKGKEGLEMLYRGGETAGKGTYWSLKNGGRVELAKDGVLPGGEASKFIKAPSAVMLPLGYVTGLLYVLALPAIAIAMAASMAGGKLLSGLLAFASRGLTFGWRPATAYFAGRKKGKVSRGGL